MREGLKHVRRLRSEDAGGCRTTGAGFASSVALFLSSSRGHWSHSRVWFESSHSFYPVWPDLLEIGRDPGRNPPGILLRANLALGAVTGDPHSSRVSVAT